MRLFKYLHNASYGIPMGAIAFLAAKYFLENSNIGLGLKIAIEVGSYLAGYAVGVGSASGYRADCAMDQEEDNNVQRGYQKVSNV